jgi:hypothetical protein
MGAMGWCCSAPKGNAVSSCGEDVAARSLSSCVCFSMPCGLSGIIGGVPVASQYLRIVPVVLVAQGDAV